MDYTALKSELTVDPLAVGYAGMDDEAAAASLNTANRAISLQYVSGTDILNATDDAEFGALTDVEKDRWLALCAIDTIDTTSGIAKSLEAAIFGAGTSTRSNLVALKNQTVSRATELGFGNVRAGDVAYARSI